MELSLLRTVFNHRTALRPWKCSKFPCGMVARGVEWLSLETCVHRPISSNERSGGGRVGEGEAYVHWYQPQDNFTRGGQRYQTGEWKMYANLTVLGAEKFYAFLNGRREERFLLRGSLCLYLKRDTFSIWFGETMNWKLRNDYREMILYISLNEWQEVWLKFSTLWFMLSLELVYCSRIGINRDE